MPEVPLGVLVHDRRTALKLTLHEAAREMGVSVSTVKNWEKGRATVGDSYHARVVHFLGYDPSPAPSSLSERLRRARKAAGLSQKVLALRLGLDPSTVRAWEAGRVGAGHSRVREVLEEFMLTVGVETGGGVV